LQGCLHGPCQGPMPSLLAAPTECRRAAKFHWPREVLPKVHLQLCPLVCATDRPLPSRHRLHLGTKTRSCLFCTEIRPNFRPDPHRRRSFTTLLHVD
ncbi:hypothetical protein CLOM_g22634, partial [Closterium sp. NIES-68]